jgi:hypothetical protein
MLKGSRNHDSGKGAPSAELGIAKPDMSLAVRDHIDNLQLQVSSILERYNVSNFEELQALGEENSDNIEMSDITRLLELASTISKAVETGTIDYEVEIPIEGYRRGAEGGIVVGDRIVFRAKESFKDSHIVTEDGKILGQDDRFNAISNPIDVSGQVGFIADLEGEQIVILEDGTEFGEGMGFTDIRGLTKINGLIAFKAMKDAKSVIALEDGREFKGNYSSIGVPTEIKGSIAFSASQYGVGFVWTEGGLIGSAKKYTFVSAPTVVGYNIAFLAVKKEGDEQIVATDEGRELHEGKGYRFNGIFDVGGKIVSRVNKRFPAKEQVPGASISVDKVFVVTEDGMEIGVEEDYDLVGTPKEIDGVIAFEVREEWRWSIVFEDGRKIVLDPEYKEVFGIRQVDENHISICAKTKTSYIRKIVEIPEKA